MPVLLTPPELVRVTRGLRDLARRSSLPAVRVALNELAARFASDADSTTCGSDLPVGQHDERHRYYRAMAAVAVSPQTRIELNRLADWYAMLAATREQTDADGDSVSVFRFCTTMRHVPWLCPLPTLPPDR